MMQIEISVYYGVAIRTSLGMRTDFFFFFFKGNRPTVWDKKYLKTA